MPENEGPDVRPCPTLLVKAAASDGRPENASKAYEIILERVGSYNAHQWKLLIITGMCGLFTSWHNMGAIYLAATPDHWCAIPHFAEQNFARDKSHLNFSVPWVKGKQGSLEPSKCSYYDYDHSSTMFQLPANISSASFDSAPNDEVLCTSWVYDDNQFTSTAVTEWNLVCDRRWVMSSIQATYMLGILVGAVVFSAASDRVGRRPTSLTCCVLFSSASIAASFMRSFGLFLAFRFVVAGAGQGMYLVNYIILMESLNSKGRGVLGSLFGAFFGTGVFLLITLSFALRDWRHLQLAISLPTLLLLSYFRLLPESPRWLLIRGREEEGLKILRSVARENGTTFPMREELDPLLATIREEIKTEDNPSAKQKIKSAFESVAVLFRTPNMRRRNLIVCYIWFVVSMTSYGLSFSGSNLNLSLHKLGLYLGTASFVALILRLFLLMKIGRRTLTSACFLLGGASLLCLLFVPTEMSNVKLAIASLGKLNMTCCFGMAFMLSAELVPTHVRNIALGMASMCARVGSATAPFIVDLLGDIYYAIPSTIFGCLSIVAGLLALLLPETRNKRLPESVEEIEEMPR